MASEGEVLVRRWVEEVLTGGNLAAIDELFAPDFVNVSEPSQARGPEGVRQGVTLLRTAFPDLRVSIDDIFGHEDRVAWMYTCRGTHRGEFAGIAATGRPVEYRGLVIARVRQGRLAEGRGLADTLAILRQLGQVDTASTPPAG